LRVGVAHGWRRRAIPRSLETSRVHERPTILWHRRGRTIVVSWLMTLTLQTCSRTMARQLARWDCIGHRVRAAVPLLSARNRSKTHRSSYATHHGRLSVRHERRHSLHAGHGASAAAGSGVPFAIVGADPGSHRRSIAVRRRTAMMLMGRARHPGRVLSALARTFRHPGQMGAVERQCSDITSIRRRLEHAQYTGIGKRIALSTHRWRRAHGP